MLSARIGRRSGHPYNKRARHDHRSSSTLTAAAAARGLLLACLQRQDIGGVRVRDVCSRYKTGLVLYSIEWVRAN
jgi:hypothetical protein